MSEMQKNVPMVVKFVCSDANVLNGKLAEAVLEDKKLILFFQEENVQDDCVAIENCQISKVEDGLFQLVFVYQDVVTTGIIDLCNHTIVFTSIVKKGAYEFVNTKGSFHLITEDYHEDKSCITNADIAVDFWLRFFDQHDETAIDEYLEEPYLQHNPTVADGVKAFRDAFHDRFFTDMKECHTEVKRVVSRGDLVFIHNILKRNPSVKGHAAVDIFRVVNGKIVEHWDVIQKMPETSVNEHPMF